MLFARQSHGFHVGRTTDCHGVRQSLAWTGRIVSLTADLTRENLIRDDQAKTLTAHTAPKRTCQDPVIYAIRPGSR